MNDTKERFRKFYTETENTLERKFVNPKDTAFLKKTEQLRFSLYPYFPHLMEFYGHSGEKVLEIGVGQGVDHSQFAKGGAELYGIDLTPRHIELTHKRLLAQGLKSQLQVGDAEDLPYDDHFFDVVYSCGVLFLVPDIKRAVSEIYRVLKPGGKVIALFYNKHSFQYYLNIIIYHGLVRGELFYLTLDVLKNWFAGDGFGYPPVRYFNKKSLKKLFSSFEQLEFFVTNLDQWQIPIISRYFTKQLLDFYSSYFGYYLTIKGQKPRIIK